MATSFVNIGTVANDGTGDPVRTAFITVNENFDLINGALFAGTQSTLISAASVTGGYFVSNSYVLATTYVNAGSIVGNTVTSNGNLYVTQQGAYIVGNVTIVGNLTVSGTQAASQAQASTGSILNIHYSATPLVVNDNKDIGIEWQYYKTAEQKAFLGWQNTTSSLVYMDAVTESAANIITAGTFGNVQFGQLLLSNTTAATSNVTGALQVKGGVGILGNLHATRANVGNLSVTGYHVGNMNFLGTDTIYINGSPVQTAASSFNGGTVGLDTTFTSNVTAANLSVSTGGNVRANVQGNIFTAAQPYITSLGALTSLAMAGTITSLNIVPNVNTTYTLGSGTSTRWNKLWTFDIDMSGTLTGGIINGTGGSHTGNIAINTTTAAALTTTTTVATVFNENATIVRIGAGGTTEFDSNTQSTSTTTGAVVVAGGVGIATGQLRIGGAGGRSITATGNAVIGGNTQSSSSSTGALVVAGGVAVQNGNVYIGGSGGQAIVHTGDIIPSANLSFNLGSATAWYGTFYGVSTQAQYADLAEKYLADAEYAVGTVVVFGGEKEITVTPQFADHRVAGVVSGKPAYLMNAMAEGTPIALRGRVPVYVVGPVTKGDLLVTAAAVPGCATSVQNDISYGIKIFAKSLETNLDTGKKIIEAVIL